MTILEAVKAVPHNADCAQDRGWPGPCVCDRDARIAKGIEAALNMAYSDGREGYMGDWGEAFAKASK